MGGLNPDYVLNEMSWMEIKYALEGLYLKDKGEWERTRLLAHVIAQSQSTKKLRPVEQWLPFWWEKKVKKIEAMDAYTFIENFDSIISGNMEATSGTVEKSGDFMKVGKYWRKVEK